MTQANTATAPTRAERKRRTEIIKQLSDFSRNGWASSRESDWKALETELNRINRKISRLGT